MRSFFKEIGKILTIRKLKIYFWLFNKIKRMTEEEFKKGFLIDENEDLGKYFYFLSNTNNDDEYMPHIIGKLQLSLENINADSIELKKMINEERIRNVPKNILDNINDFIRKQLKPCRVNGHGNIRFLYVFKIK